MSRCRPVTFTLLALAAAVAGTLALHAGGLARNMHGCELRDQRPGEFVAYCANPYFTDYEHGAAYYDLEPAFSATLREADILFLGNSIMQRAIRTEVFAPALGQRGIRYAQMGFGYSERYRFPVEVMARLGLKPKLLVVNGDAFFEGALSQPATRILEDRFSQTHLGYLYRRWLQHARHRLCADGPEWLCGGGLRVTYRETATGAWRTPLPPARFELREPKEGEPAAGKLREQAANARELLARTGIAPECLVVTKVPTALTGPALARALAARIGAPFVRPELAGLRGTDRDHFDPESARRWSAAFLEALGPAIERCVR